MSINIDDINYITSHEELNPQFRKDKYHSGFFLVVKNWLYIILRGIISIPYFFYNYYKGLEHSAYMFLAFSGNNERALSPICGYLPGSVNFSMKNPLPLKRIWWYSMLYSPGVIYKYFSSTGYLKKAYASDFINYCQCYGYYIEAKKILSRINPEMIILANDHTHPQRAFFRAAQHLGIKTTYIQHASVSENFPPLEFDFTFLDGMESYEKYTAKNKPVRSIVFLSGNPRFDIIEEYANAEQKSSGTVRCGIAINAMDKIDKIKSLIKKLKVQDIQVTLRPHPGMKQDFWKKFANEHSISISDSSVENPFEFISNNNFFISGESSFHLDVVLFGKNSYFFNFTGSESVLDIYGYIKNGLMPDITSLSEEELYNLLKCPKSNDSQVISYYVSNYNTPYWGKSASLIASTFLNLKNKTELKNWIEEKENVYIIKENE